MNINAEIREILTRLSLNKTEVDVYLATLELGSGVASTIAKMAGLNRVTTYEALKRLSAHGFIKIRVKKNDRTKYFVPAQYEEIIAKLEQIQSQIAESLKSARLLKNEFTAQFSPAEEKPQVFFYEGQKGVREVLNDTLKSNPNEIVSFSSAEGLESGFDKVFLDDYWKRRTRLGISTRGIIPKTTKAVDLFSAEKNKSELREVRFLPPSIYQFTNEIDIYENSIGITSLTKGGEHGIIIKSSSIAKSMRALFETLWVLSGSGS